MSDEKTLKERIRELEEEYLESVKDKKRLPGLPEMEIVYGGAKRRKPVRGPVTIQGRRT